ncbi:MAG: carboxypeptidase-like regulatory domain-containing protein, partial [Crocinitomicaceae bacterium]
MKSNNLLKQLLFLALVLTSFASFSQETATLTGKVSDETGEPIFDATILVANTQIGAKSDFDGIFELTGIPVEGDKQLVTIILRGIGFDEKSFEIEFMPGQTVSQDLSAGEYVLNIDEVVVVGYGTTRTKDLTGAATKISSEDFNQTPVANPEQLIQGKVAGVKIKDGISGDEFEIKSKYVISA